MLTTNQLHDEACKANEASEANATWMWDVINKSLEN